MQLTPVSSSSIDAIGHDADSNTLQVRFASGQTYEYSGVTPEEHEALRTAPSVGAHFAKHVRPHFAGKKK